MDDSQGRLLIVEDDSALRRSLRTTLDVLGFDVGEASNGEDGLVRLRMVDYEAVLLDINMPGMGILRPVGASGAFTRKCRFLC
jgi:two-component system KDP operon response regulator KdpE